MKMELLKLRTDLHALVDLIKDEQLLQSLHDFLRENSSREGGELWQSLTDNQKKEVLVSSIEALDDDNLVEASVVFKKLNEDSAHKKS